MRHSRLVGHGLRGVGLLLGVLIVAGLSASWGRARLAADDQTSLGAGVYPAAYAIKGAKVVAGTGKTFEPGTVVVRRGVVEAVGLEKDVPVPYDAETIDGKGLTVYPGFIDLFTTIGQRQGVERSATGRGKPVDLAEAPLVATPPDNRRGLTPEFEVAGVLELTEAAAEPRRRLGFTDLISAPGGAIATGQSALVSLSGLPRREAIIAAPVALHINVAPPFEPAGAVAAPPGAPGTTPGQFPGRGRGFGAQSGPTENPYPRVLMGSVAHLRQAMLDAEHLVALESHVKQHGGAQPPYDPALKALHAARTKTLAVWWEANTRDEIHRALDLAEEFGTSAVIVGGKEAHKVVDRLKAKKVPVILRLNVPEEPKVPTEAEFRAKPADERDEPLRVLAHKNKKWKEELATASVLVKAGVPVAFATDGLDRLDAVPANLRHYITAGLSADDVLAALTRNAAAIAGVDRRLGTIEPGKLGHVVVTTGPLTEEKSKVRYVLVDGLKFEIKPEDRARGGRGMPKGDIAEKGKRGGPRGKAAQEDEDEETTPAKKPAVAKAEPKPAAQPGKPVVTLETPKTGAMPEAVAKIKSKAAAKAGEKLDVAKAEAPSDKKAMSALAPAASPKAEVKKEPPAVAKTETAKKPDTPKTEAPKTPPARFVDVATEFDEDRKPSLSTGGSVLIKDATILTVTKGTIPKGSILIEKGKIKAVGKDVTAPAGVKVIDATGLVAMPGIIDTHSHIAIQGNVNEATLSVVPEVRVKDVVTGDDIDIYRAVAGGVTTARLLHGSANTIGGQDAVAKMKYGQPGRDLIIRTGPQGVKFALGENVTRSPRRFPNTRMGVESVLERAFDEAKAYRVKKEAYKKAVEKKETAKFGPPPRVDLRLEALAGVLDGSIKIHSHCYRSDEILMLLNTAQRYGVRVQSLQHVLEGYKVAAEIAEHGASASTFSDWWAYKIEAYDAIPSNASLLTEAGASVCIKSDDAEMMRHLNLEAAKMVKYGPVTEAQALAMITINPARELGLDGRIGSIEVGKDADIALFNGHPFDAFARCELTLIEGEVAFQRKEAGGGFAPRPGDHLAMPGPADGSRKRLVEIVAQPKAIFALVGANVHPVKGPVIKGGTVVVSKGKILAVGAPGTPIPPEAQTIDLSGLDVWPGMIDAGSPIGLFEIGSLSETQDFADSAQYQPELRSSVALRADSEHIPVTRANGVLTSYVQPSGGIISGQGCLISLNGWVPREMVIADRVALDVIIPTFVPRAADSARPGIPGTPGRPGQGPGGGAANDAQQRRKERLERIKELFKKSLAYDLVVSKARERGEVLPTPDARLEALVPYARGQKPVIFHAQHSVEILDVIDIARELKLNAIISGGSDAWKVVDDLKKAKIPVLLSGSLVMPNAEHDPYDALYSNASKLHAAGVTVAFHSQNSGAGSATAMRNLPYEAASAVAFGLPEDAALEAVTLGPARILGFGDQLGSIEPGKRANLVVTAGHLLQPTTQVLGLFIDGEPIKPESRHTQLYDKYHRRLEELRRGTATPGLEAGTHAATGGR